MPPNLVSWGDSRPYGVLQRTLDKDCRQAQEPKQLVHEASRFHLEPQRQHCGHLLWRFAIQQQSTAPQYSHKSGRWATRVLQGSVLGPILFLLYTADLLQLVKHHQLIPHACTDNTQIYGFCRPADSAVLCEKVSICVNEVSAWMASNRLQLYHAKTEVLWCTSSCQQHQMPTGPVRIGTTDVQPVSLIRDLGVYIDADMSMRTHVTAIVRACFAALRQIRSVTTCLADLGSCTDCQQGGLLQLGFHWYPRPAARPAAVSLECRRPFGFLSKAVRTHNPIAS